MSQGGPYLSDAAASELAHLLAMVPAGSPVLAENVEACEGFIERYYDQRGQHCLVLLSARAQLALNESNPTRFLDFLAGLNMSGADWQSAARGSPLGVQSLVILKGVQLGVPSMLAGLLHHDWHCPGAGQPSGMMTQMLSGSGLLVDDCLKRHTAVFEELDQSGRLLAGRLAPNWKGTCLELIEVVHDCD